MKSLSLSFMFVCLLILSNIVAHADLKSGLIVYYTFNEGKGKEVKNSASDKHIATLQGILPEWVKGKRDNALDFKQGGWVDAPNLDELSLIEAGTVAAWVNIRSTSPTKWRAVVSKGTSTDAQVNYVLDVRENAPRFYLANGAAAHYTYDENAKIPFDTWNFIAGVFDGKMTKLLVNGKFTLEMPQPFKPKANTEDLRIGAYNKGADNSPNGIIDEVAIYNRALTLDELKTLMDEGLKGILTVFPNGKLATLWGKVKSSF